MVLRTWLSVGQGRDQKLAHILGQNSGWRLTIEVPSFFLGALLSCFLHDILIMIQSDLYKQILGFDGEPGEVSGEFHIIDKLPPRDPISLHIHFLPLQV